MDEADGRGDGKNYLGHCAITNFIPTYESPIISPAIAGLRLPLDMSVLVGSTTIQLCVYHTAVFALIIFRIASFLLLYTTGVICVNEEPTHTRISFDRHN